MSIIVFQDESLIEKLIEKATELKEACDKIGDAKGACEAVESAIKRLSEADDGDMLEEIALLGTAIELLKTWAPEGVGSFFTAYATALQSIAKSLQDIPLTPYDKALDRAFDETGNLAEAIKLADRFVPDAPAADRARAIKRVQTRIQQAELKKKGYKPEKRWYEWEYLPWNWFGSSFVPNYPLASFAGTGVTIAVAVIALTSMECVPRTLEVELRPIGTSFSGYVAGDFGPCDNIDCSLPSSNSDAYYRQDGVSYVAAPPRPPVDWTPCRYVWIGDGMLKIDNDRDGWCDELIMADGSHVFIPYSRIVEDIRANPSLADAYVYTLKTGWPLPPNFDSLSGPSVEPVAPAVRDPGYRFGSPSTSDYCLPAHCQNRPGAPTCGEGATDDCGGSAELEQGTCDTASCETETTGCESDCDGTTSDSTCPGGCDGQAEEPKTAGPTLDPKPSDPVTTVDPPKVEPLPATDPQAPTPEPRPIPEAQHDPNASGTTTTTQLPPIEPTKLDPGTTGLHK